MPVNEINHRYWAGVVTVVCLTLLLPFATLASAGDAMSVREGPDLSVSHTTFVAAKLSGGTVLPTNDFVKGKYSIPVYGAYSLKFGLNSTGRRWQDIVYGMPYYGIGLHTADFGRRKDLGKPFSVYLLQGATLKRFSPRLELKYEWNLGVSMGWKHYDAFDNPRNVALGSEVNIHVGAVLYVSYKASNRMQFNFGADVTHFSNGASRLPNAGLNMASVFVEAKYNFDIKKLAERIEPSLAVPEFDKRFVSEILLTISSRQQSVDTVGTGLPSIYVDRNFKVLGMNYSVMRVPGYRYRYGLSADLLYDESSGVRAWREYNNRDGKWYDRIQRGSVGERFSFGLSARGEVVNPGYSIFANIGWQLIHGNKNDSRFYQILGVKIYLKENFFGTFGIRANHFSKAQYLFWSFGYTIEHRKKGKGP